MGTLAILATAMAEPKASAGTKGPRKYWNVPKKYTEKEAYIFHGTNNTYFKDGVMYYISCGITKYEMPPIVEELSTIFVAPISHYRRIFHERDVCYDRDAWTEKGGSNWAAYSETVTKKIGFRKLGDAPVGLIGAVPFRAKLAREVKDPPTDVDDYLFSQDYAPPIDFSSRFEDLFSALNASESNDDVYSEFTDPENVDEFLAYFSREIDRLFQNDTWLEKYEDLVDSLEKAGFDVDYDDVGSVLIACEYDSRVTAYWEVKVNDYVDISKFTDVYLENVRDDDVKRLKESGFRGKVHKLGDGGLYGGR